MTTARLRKVEDPTGAVVHTPIEGRIRVDAYTREEDITQIEVLD